MLLRQNPPATLDVIQVRQDLEPREVVMKRRKRARPDLPYQRVRGQRPRRQVPQDLPTAIVMMLRGGADAVAMPAKRPAVRWNYQVDVERLQQLQRVQILRQHVVLRMPGDVRGDLLQQMIARNQVAMLRRIQAQVPR